MKRSTNFAVVAFVVVGALTLTTLAAAQTGDERRAIFEGAKKTAAGVGQVQVFAAPPKSFNPLSASKQELWQYGLPAAPDKEANPLGYAKWAKAMTALKTHATGVQAKPYSSTNAHWVPGRAEAANADGNTFVSFYNWSGIANFKTISKWSKTNSFDEVVSYFNVPVSDHPFGNLPCSEGPWFEVTWNGIDGYNNGDVVQGGSAIYWDGGGCGGPVEYYGWVEWYPSYSILAIYCGSSTCFVSPGDDFYVVTYGAPGTSTQSVFVEDISQQWWGTFSLPYVSGPGLVGKSAEYIVERPCCVGSNEYPLNNYVAEFMGYNYAYTDGGTLFFPGSTTASTSIITMVDDSASINISAPVVYGTSGSAGRYSIMLEDENCAFSGGCTP